MPFNTNEKELKRHLICRSLEIWWWWKQREEVGERRDEDLELFEAARERQKRQGKESDCQALFLYINVVWILSIVHIKLFFLSESPDKNIPSLHLVFSAMWVHQRGKISMVPTTLLTFHVEKNCSTRNVGCFPQRTVPFTRRDYIFVWFKPINNWSRPLYGWLCIQEHVL